MSLLKDTSLLHVVLLLTLSHPVFFLSDRKKKQGKGKKKGSDDSDSDDVEVIKEWNTSSRGKNGEGRNRAESVDERKSGVLNMYWVALTIIPKGLQLYICIVCAHRRREKQLMFACFTSALMLFSMYSATHTVRLNNLNYL